MNAKVRFDIDDQGLPTIQAEIPTIQEDLRDKVAGMFFTPSYEKTFISVIHKGCDKSTNTFQLRWNSINEVLNELFSILTKEGTENLEVQEAFKIIFKSMLPKDIT